MSEDQITIATTTHLMMISIYVSNTVAFWAGVAVIVKWNPMEVLQDRIAKLKISLAAMHDKGDAHLEMTLLRSCFALPKLSAIG